MREYAIGTTVGLKPSLTPACIAEIEANGTTKLYCPEDRHYLQGETAQSIYLLQTGRVKSVLTDRAGNESFHWGTHTFCAVPANIRRQWPDLIGGIARAADSGDDQHFARNKNETGA